MTPCRPFTTHINKRNFLFKYPVNYGRSHRFKLVAISSRLAFRGTFNDLQSMSIIDNQSLINYRCHQSEISYLITDALTWMDETYIASLTDKILTTFLSKIVFHPGSCTNILYFFGIPRINRTKLLTFQHQNK